MSEAAEWDVDTAFGDEQPELNIEHLRAKLDEFNDIAQQMGMPEFALVRPEWCLPREVNARYMDELTLAQLAENIRADGRLESVPLVMPADTPAGKEAEQHEWFETLSGHHRIKGALRAGIEWVIVLVCHPTSESQATAKQLSHNALVGSDEKATLKKMFDSLDSEQEKLYSGLSDSLEKELAQLGDGETSMNVPLSFSEFLLIFIPREIENYDSLMRELEQFSTVDSSTTVRLVSMESMARFKTALEAVKKTENVKSNSEAFVTMLDLATERLEQLKRERQQ